jgi:hypothetical protein
MSSLTAFPQATAPATAPTIVTGMGYTADVFEEVLGPAGAASGSALIRSIQRLEGNPDCFGTAGDSCEQTLCAWREYCLKPTKPDWFHHSITDSDRQYIRSLKS